MADINDPELTRAIEELTRTLNGLGSAADTGSAKFRAAADQVFKVKGSGEALERSLKSLGNTVTALGKKMYEGQKGATQYADAADAAAEAVGDFTSQLGPMGKAFSVALNVAVKYFGAAARQADKLQKGFFDLAKVGGQTSRGMADVRSSLRDFSLGIDEISTLTRLVAENSQSLAMLGGTVSRGTKAVGAFTREITSNDGLLLQFKNMGIGLDEINENAFGFAALYARNGSLQTKTTQQATAALQEYIKETDAITRLTGATRKEQEAARNRAMQIDAFRREQELAARAGATEAERKAAAEALKTFNMLSALGPEGKKMAEGFAMMRRGFITEGPGLAMAMLSGGEAYQIAMDNNMTAAQKTEKLISVMSRAADAIGGGVADANQFAKAFGGLEYYGIKDIAQLGQRLEMRMDEIFDEQGKMTDKATKRMNEMGISQIRSRDSLQDFVSMGIGPATVATKAFADVVEFVTRLLPGGRAAVEAAKKATGAAPSAAGPAAGGAAPPGGDLASKIIKAEGGGVTARNPYSSASGLGQITRGRYQDLVKNAKVGSKLYGTTFEQYQGDAGLQQEALNAQIDSLKGYLASKGLSTTDAAVYMAHVFGPAGARAVLSHADQVSVGALFGEDIISKNPAIFRGVSTVGDLKKVISDKMGGTGYRTGGVATGPDSGYLTTLHGAEAVVPLPDGRTIPVEIKGLGTDELVQQLGGYLARANRMYRETLPEAGIYKTTSAEYMTAVMQLYDMAATRAAEAQLRGIDYVKRLEMSGGTDRQSLMKELAEGGVTTGPSIAGERGPEAVVPLPDGRTIPVTMTGLGEGIAEMISLLRTNNDISQKILQMSSS